MARSQRTEVKTIIKQGNPRLSVFIINKKNVQERIPVQ